MQIRMAYTTGPDLYQGFVWACFGFRNVFPGKGVFFDRSAFLAAAWPSKGASRYGALIYSDRSS